MLGLFLLLRIVVAVDEHVVVVLVRVPERAVLPLAQRVVGVVVRDVIVVVGVSSGGVGMLGLLALALCVLGPNGC